MKKTIKIAAWLLALTSLFSVAGCKPTGGDTSTSDSVDGNYVSSEGLGEVTGTVHERYIGSTSHKLLSAGETEYKIVVNPEEKTALSLAITELQNLFSSATGAKLELETNENIAYDENAKYISLGNTGLLETSGIVVDAQTIGAQGYEIITKGKSIFVCGQKRGVMYGVYDMLKTLIDFETYSNKISYYQKNVKDIPLPDFKIKEVPDIEYRIPVMGSLLQDRTATNRMFMQNKDEIIMSEGNAHNILEYIVPIEEHLDEHSGWFSGDRTQLCYTAHGDETEYQLMVDTAIENVKKIIDKNPNRNSFGITQMDIQTWCECETCQGLEDYYGTNAASQIFFINDVTSEVETWLNEEREGREVEFMFFAYHKSEAAPAKRDENGNWVAIDDKVKVNDNVSVWIALLYENYTISVTDPMSVNVRNIMESWHACTDNYYIWAYNVYFDNYLIPYDSYGAMQDMVKYFVMNGTRFLWAQGNWNLHQNTGYDDLKAYLFAKLMWNCNLDVNELISDYFDKVYREAADIMEGTFWAWRAHSEQQRLLGRNGNIYSSPKDMKFWPKRYLVGQLEAMEEAKKAIAHYQDSDTELYQAIYDSIVCETITLRYLMLDLYFNTFSTAELAAFKAEFKEDTNRLDFNMISEQASMDGFVD
jgi:hypothetical protein